MADFGFATPAVNGDATGETEFESYRAGRVTATSPDLGKSIKSEAERAEKHFMEAIQGNPAIISIGTPTTLNGARSLAVYVDSRNSPEAEKLYLAEMDTADRFPASGLSILILENRKPALLPSRL